MTDDPWKRRDGETDDTYLQRIRRLAEATQMVMLVERHGAERGAFLHALRREYTFEELQSPSAAFCSAAGTSEVACFASHCGDLPNTDFPSASLEWLPFRYLEPAPAVCRFHDRDRITFPGLFGPNADQVVEFAVAVAHMDCKRLRLLEAVRDPAGLARRARLFLKGIVDDPRDRDRFLWNQWARNAWSAVGDAVSPELLLDGALRDLVSAAGLAVCVGDRMGDELRAACLAPWERAIAPVEKPDVLAASKKRRKKGAAA